MAADCAYKMPEELLRCKLRMAVTANPPQALDCVQPAAALRETALLSTPAALTFFREDQAGARGAVDFHHAVFRHRIVERVIHPAVAAGVGSVGIQDQLAGFEAGHVKGVAEQRVSD